MKRFLMAVVLTCALSGAALAGDVPHTAPFAPQAAHPVLMVILDVIDVVTR